MQIFSRQREMVSILKLRLKLTSSEEVWRDRRMKKMGKGILLFLFKLVKYSLKLMRLNPTLLLFIFLE